MDTVINVVLYIYMGTAKAAGIVLFTHVFNPVVRLFLLILV